MRIKKMIILFILLTLSIFFVSGCMSSYTDYSTSDNETVVENIEYEDANEEKNSYSEDNEYDDDESVQNDLNSDDNVVVEFGDVGNINKTEEKDEIDNLPVWNIYKELSFDFSYEGQEQNYSFVAPENGNYRFSFDIDNRNMSYGYTLYTEDHTIIEEGDYERDFTEILEKNQRYVLKIFQEVGLPESKISLGVPKPIQEITDTVISSTFEYVDQEDIYKYSAVRNGIYGIELISNNVEYSYDFYIIDTANNCKIESGSSSTNGKEQVFLNPELESGKTYKFIVSLNDIIPDSKFEYTIKINIPNEIKKIDLNVVEGELIFGGQNDKFTFTPSKSAEYELVFNDYNEPMGYYVTVYDDRNKKIGEFYNHSSEARIDLSEDIEYIIEISQENQYGEYYFEFVEIEKEE